MLCLHPNAKCAAAGGKESEGKHAAELLPDSYEHVAGPHPTITGRTLFAWKQAVGPHLAVSTEGKQLELATVTWQLLRFTISGFEVVITRSGLLIGTPCQVPLILEEHMGGAMTTRLKLIGWE